jgi:ParB family chromosome partitioning protein
MTLENFELDNLTISPLNMRHAKKAPDISDLLPSVRTRGILMPLLVRRNGSPATAEIVAGRRRYYAAHAVKAERGSFPPVPCKIMEEGDDADALEASLIENLHRSNPSEMEQYATISRLILKENRSIQDAGKALGLSTREVEQRMALGNLLPRLREAYSSDRIDVATIRHLTMATKRQQQEWLKAFEADDENAPFGDDVKNWLCGGQSISTSVALFPLNDYKGHVLTDLFGEHGTFQDADLFFEQQSLAIAARRDAYLAAGWCEVVILDKGETFQSWQFEKTTKKNGGKVFIGLSHRGEVTFHEGYLARKEARKKANAEGTKGAGTEAETPAAPASEVTAALQSYIDLHRHAAVRAAVLDKPGVALRLLAVHAMCGSRLWKVAPEPQRSGRNETDASVQASPAQAAFIASRQEVLTLLGLSEGAGLVATHGDEPAAIFARLLALSDAEVRRVLTVIMADSLEAGSALVEAAGVHLGVDMAKCWTADEAFFDLVRDKGVVSAMVADIAGKAVANANVSATGKVQKQIIKDCLTGTNGREKVASWLPRWMEFPVRSYKKDGGFRTAEAWKRIKRHFRTE